MTRFASVADLRRAIAGSDVALPTELQEATLPVVSQPSSSAPSTLEEVFLSTWLALGGLPLVREFRFDPQRRWRFDFALPPLAIAIEIEGGLRSNGRHTRAQGFIGDCDKYNAATMAGWRVIRLTTAHLSPLHIQPIVEWTTQEATKCSGN